MLQRGVSSLRIWVIDRGPAMPPTRVRAQVPFSGRAQRQADDARRRLARAVRAEAAYLRSLTSARSASTRQVPLDGAVLMSDHAPDFEVWVQRFARTAVVRIVGSSGWPRLRLADVLDDLESPCDRVVLDLSARKASPRE